MRPIEFEWDKAKAVLNLRKHRVSFEEARSVFLDGNARLIADPDHSEMEDRFILLGLSDRLRLLVVCHCYRQNSLIIRIVSARKADKGERFEYEEHRA